MTQYDLFDPRYITPLNRLPVIVDACGEYVARNGAKIVVTEIKPVVDKSVSIFSVKGYYYPITPTKSGGAKKPVYSIWHVSGAATCASTPQNRDIVRKK